MTTPTGTATPTALDKLLDSFEANAQTEREKGTNFEDLIVKYLQFEPKYKDLYETVWTYSKWAAAQGITKTDIGIDLVAQVRGSGDFHAIQCKNYRRDHIIAKGDIDSFFTASGKKPFTHRIIIVTTDRWTENAKESLDGQHTPVNVVNRSDLESSQIDWTRFQIRGEPVLREKKRLREHQKIAVAAVIAGLKSADRGKLLMACGSGKTFAALKIAEDIAGAGGRVLFLVPSLNLLSQTLTEWTQESAVPLHSFAVCSDSDVGKKSKSGEDSDAVSLLAHELNYPATTEPSRLAIEMSKRHDSKHMSVVFSTYHSIDVISKAQKKHGLAEFDLIICDEAHRTTGATFEDEDESAFVKVHDAAFLRARKRLYMTATPRIYGDAAKGKAEQENITLCSMDDEELYGRVLHTLSFSEAVKRGLLVDYKVIVLAVEESHISRRLQNLFKDENNQLKVDDAAKIVGCWKALSKQGLTNDLDDDDSAMRRAVAFCQVIEISKAGKSHRVSSKQVATMFQAVVQAYQASEVSEGAPAQEQLICEAEHVDGGMNASTKTAKIDWLKAEAPSNTCRILSNVRCLSEGVDVPALDAVLFLTPRNSQVDVVQSVGRVMRNAPGKQRGYVILPVVTPAGIEPHEALNKHKTYAVVWQVLQALRSHDDRFDAMVNKLDLIGADSSKMEIIAITDKIQKAERGAAPAGKSHVIGSVVPKQSSRGIQGEFQYEVGELERAIYAKLVQKVGNRRHWEEWANDIAKIAGTHIDRITGILENPRNSRERKSFDAFARELRDDLNQTITDGQVIEMLAQHLITKPVFDSLFEKYSFTTHNPISIAMQRVLDTLQEHHIEKESDTLQAFYASVQMRAEGIDNAAGKQKIVKELYEKFFGNAFPNLTKRLGIVYTPVEVVDFILHSVEHLLKNEFGQSLGSEGVHILDPFTGTGTFITRLLQSGLIPPDQMARKYQKEIRANEIVLLAYYIAAINIEAVYHSIVGGEYQPFKGICLTDTFQLYEAEDLLDALLEDNSDRRKEQKALDIRVIVGNPPYSVGQGNENDNNKNVGYPQLDQRIRGTYAAQSEAVLSKGLYDSYIRAIRWASDRIGKSGVIGFVTNAGWVEARTADGLRKALAAEFASLYVFHLRGNANTSGELRRKEKDNVFAGGTKTPIAISLLVKNPAALKQGQIHFHHVGDYLNREEKLDLVAQYKSIAGITQAGGWQALTPDAHGDWINQRDESFGNHIVLGDKSGVAALTLFANYSNGVKTNRDAWCYNGSKKAVAENMSRMIDFYNREVGRFGRVHAGLDRQTRENKVDDFIAADATKISWTRELKYSLMKSERFAFEPSCLMQSLYRPFTKQWLYYNRHLNNCVYQMPRIFPDAEAENRVITVNASHAGEGQIALIMDSLPDLHSNGDSQCFPLYLYDEPESDTDDSLFSASKRKSNKRTRRSALTDEGLAHFRAAYPSEKITKEDIFYYIYGLLHSPDYRARFADNLSKEIPRIPCVKRAAHFRALEQAGRDLAKLHINYESVKPYRLKMEHSGTLTNADYRVEKMRYAKDKDKTTLHYNDRITLTGIPLEAYEYVVNGKPALDWVVERQGVSTHKDSGIVNDANDWARETMKDPRYPLDLFCRVVTVSLETMKIVNALPQLDI